MTEPPPAPPASTFVVRLWREWSVAGPRWRGQVDHVQSGETARFLDLEELLDIIRSFGVIARQARQPDGISEHQEPPRQAARPSPAEPKGSD
jgi:hypothetical protein